MAGARRHSSPVAPEVPVVVWARLARACHHGGMSSGIQEWFADRIPTHWNATGLDVISDQDEILVLVDLPPTPDDRAAGPRSPASLPGVERATSGWRWPWRPSSASAARCPGAARAGDVVVVFTTASVPVMTRLRLPERRVLDTLIDAGVARSRSEALAWCVRLVGDNEKEWIGELRAAFAEVEAVRERGPRSRRDRTPHRRTGLRPDAAG